MSQIKQKELKKQVSSYEKAQLKKSIGQIMNTFVPFIALWGLAYLSLSVSYLLSLVCCVIASGFMVRMFIIFHDCCHYSFFKSRKANDILGTITGVLTMFPYRQWQHSHSIHHATSGNLDKRGIGDIWLLTIEEYEAASNSEKFKYRLYRNPFVMFVMGPIWAFLIKQRFNQKGAKRKERINTYITNISMVLLYGMMCSLIGWEKFVMIQLPIFWLSGMMGIWLFYVQHHFEDSYYEWNEEWKYVQAAVEGSSFYKLPKLLQWMTGNIGYHHVHHLSPRVPNYSLESAHEHADDLKCVPELTIKQSIKAIRFRLWDENKKTFISFGDLKKEKTETNTKAKIHQT